MSIHAYCQQSKSNFKKLVISKNEHAGKIQIQCRWNTSNHCWGFRWYPAVSIDVLSRGHLCHRFFCLHFACMGSRALFCDRVTDEHCLTLCSKYFTQCATLTRSPKSYFLHTSCLTFTHNHTSVNTSCPKTLGHGDWTLGQPGIDFPIGRSLVVTP